MGLSPELFPKSLGEIVAELVRQKYPTAKGLARAWDISVKAAETVRDGHFGIRIMASAIAAEGWQFIEALGESALGETYEQYQMRLLEAKIQEVENAQQTVVRLRSRREALERKAGEIGGLRDRQGSIQNG